MRPQGSPTPSDSIPHPATAPISTVVSPVLTYGACAHTLGSSDPVAMGGDGAGSRNIRVGDRSGEVAICGVSERASFNKVRHGTPIRVPTRVPREGLGGAGARRVARVRCMHVGPRAQRSWE